MISSFFWRRWTKDEIEVEAKAWFDLVRAKEREISAAELDVHRKNREIALLEKQKAAAAELAKASQVMKAAGHAGAGSDRSSAALQDRWLDTESPRGKVRR